MRNPLQLNREQWPLGLAMAAALLLVSSTGFAQEPPSYEPDVPPAPVEEPAQEQQLDADAILRDDPDSSLPDPVVPGSSAPECPGNCCGQDVCCDDGLFRLRGGLSYYDHPNADSKVGGTYGLDGLLPMTEAAGAYAAAKANHVSGGSQYYTSIGLYRMANPCGDSAWECFGGAVFYDYFTDSRPDINLTMYRLYIGAAMTENWSVGWRHIERGDDDDGGIIGGGGIGTYHISQSDAVYASGYVDCNLLTVAVGHREDPSTAFLEAALRRPVRSNLFAFVDTHYEERGDWAAITGLEFRFGPGGSRCSCGNHCSYCRRSPWDDPTIAEAFNWGEAKTFGAAVDVDKPSGYYSENSEER